MDREAWQATVHGVTESDMTKQVSTAFIMLIVSETRNQKRVTCVSRD